MKRNGPDPIDKKHNRSRRGPLTLFFLLLLLLIGSFATWMEARAANRFMKEIMLGEALMLAESLDRNQLASLSGTMDDLDLPEYHVLRDQLIRMRAANSRYRYLYLFGKREGEKPFFFMGTAPEDSPDYSPPGMVYFEDSPTLNQVLASHESSVSPPFKDRWGTWISALVPIIEPGDDRLLAVFGMDSDARQWKIEIYRRSMMPVVLTFFMIIMVITLLEYARRRQLASENKILADSAQRLTHFFDVVPDFLLLIDLEGKVQKANRSLLDAVGLSVDDMMGQSIFDFIHPDDLDRTKAAIFSSLPEGPIREYVLRIRTSQAGYRTVEWHSRSHDRQIYIAGRDITERLHVENQMRQLQKTEVLGKLAGGIAHDFNNLLQAIIGNTLLLKEQLPVDSQAMADLEEVQRASEMAANLTRQLLAFSRKSELKPTRLEVNTVVHESARMIRRLIGADIELNFYPREDAGAILGDRAQIEQILLNLCINAKDAMPKGGSLVIRTEQAQLDEAYCEINAWARPGDYVILTVTDNGEGMDQETLLHIFEPFFTTKAENKGTGLGLATVHAIVKKHEGLISVYSEPGKGTIFRNFFPKDDSSCANRPEQKIEARRGRGELILLAEDNDSVRQMMKAILEKNNYQVLAAVDGPQALSLFAQHGSKIDCLILDLVMPRMSGVEVYRSLASENRNLHCLFISGYSDSLSDLQLQDDGRLEIMQKPYHPHALLEKLQSLLM